MIDTNNQNQGASSTAKTEPRGRIAVLLDHSGHGDSRVLNTVHALNAAGHKVQLFTLHRFDSPEDAASNLDQPPLPITHVHPVFLDNQTIVPGWMGVANGVRRAKTLMRRAPGEDTDNDRQPLSPLPTKDAAPSSARFVGRLNATLGALFWHRALAQTFERDVTDFAPDIIIANDLSMLGAGIACARATGAKLIYDAHEYEAGRNGVQNRLNEAVRQTFEPKLITQTDAVVSVSLAVGQQLQTDHPRLGPVQIIPNAAPTNRAFAHVKTSLRKSLNISPDHALALYVGSAAKGRGLEPLIQALQHIPNLTLAYLGNISPERRETLDRLTAQYGVKSQWHVVPPVPADAVGGLLAQADLSVIPIQPSCTSYRLSLPNKLFQSLAAGTPVLATPLPEITAVLGHCAGGLVTDGFDAPALMRGLDTMLAAPPKVTIDAAFMAAYGRDATDARWQALIHALLTDQPIDTQTLPQLPHYDHPALQLPPRPISEIIPTGWRRIIGHILVAFTTPWTVPSNRRKASRRK